MFSGLEASLVRVRRVRVWEGLESEEGEEEEEEDGGDDELPCSILMLVPSDGGGGGWDEDERMARALLPLRSACFRFPGIM